MEILQQDCIVLYHYCSSDGEGLYFVGKMIPEKSTLSGNGRCERNPESKNNVGTPHLFDTVAQRVHWRTSRYRFLSSPSFNAAPLALEGEPLTRATTFSKLGKSPYLPGKGPSSPLGRSCTYSMYPSANRAKPPERSAGTATPFG